MADPVVRVLITGDSTEFVASLEQASAAADAAVESLDASAAGLTGSLDGAGAAADTLGAGLVSVEGSAKSAAATLDSAAGTMDAGLEGVRTTAEQLSLQLDSIGPDAIKSSDQMVTGLEETTKASDDVLDRLYTLGDTVDDVGEEVETTSTTSVGALARIGAALEMLEGKFGLVGEAAGKMGASISASAEEGQAALDEDDVAAGGLAGGLASIGKAGLVALGVVAFAAIDLGDKMDQAKDSIAASADITVAKAGQITAAFTGTGAQFTESGVQFAQAYSGVAAQLGSTEGKALNAGQALLVMTAAANAAEASHSSLTSTTSALAATMQAYQIKAGGAANASNILFVAGETTGQGISAVSNSLDKMAAKLGGLAPPLAQSAGLLDDLTQHGETGRAAMTALSSTVTSLIKPNEDLIQQQSNANNLFKQLPASLQPLAKAYQEGKVSATDWTTATSGLGAQVGDVASKFGSAVTGVQTASSAIKDSGDLTIQVGGKFVGFGSIIGQLHDKIEGMGKIQATATLAQDGLGASAGKFLKTVEAGPAAYDKAVAATDKAKAAQAAAAKATDNFKGQFDKLKAGTENMVTAIGEKLLPILSDLEHMIIVVAGWLEKHKAVALALAAVIGGIMVGAFVAMAVAAWAAAAPILAMAAPFIAVGVAIGALGFGIYELVDHWKEVWGEIKKIADDAWHFLENDVIHPIEDAFKTAIDFIKDHWKVLTEILLAPIAPVIAFFLAFHGQITKIFEDIINDVIGFFTALPGEIGSVLGDAVSQVFSAWEDAGGWIHTNVIQPVVGFFAGLPGDIASGIGSVFSVIFRGFLGAATWIESNVITPVVSYFEQLPGRIVAGLGNIIGTIWRGFTGAAEWIETNVIVPTHNFFAGLPGKILTGLGDVGSLLINAGKDIVKGLIKGITDSWSDVWTFLKSKLTGLVGNVLSFFHIGSPSKLFAEIGGNLMKGLAVGINETASEASSALSSATSGLIPSLGSGGVSLPAAVAAQRLLDRDVAAV